MDTRWGQMGHAAHEVQLLRAGQLPGQGHLVDGLAALEQGHGRIEADLVAFPVEVALLQERGEAGEAPAVDHDRAEDSLLGLEVVGQQLLRVGGHGVVSSVRGGGGPACRGTWLRVSAGTAGAGWAVSGPSPRRRTAPDNEGLAPVTGPAQLHRGCGLVDVPVLLVLHGLTSRVYQERRANPLR